jgi:choline dehydrogenase-like flavoprotein
MRRSLEAVGATEIWDETDDTCHLNGTAKMGGDPKTSVVNADCRSWISQICGFATVRSFLLLAA